jgi:hypothetical protein
MAAETVLIDFGVKVITEELAKTIENFEYLRTPAEGYVSWYNDTDEFVDVETFDEKDAVRWVRYEERRIAPRQVVLLTARGQLIHIRVRQNGATYDCDKKQAYLWNGQNVYPKQN